MRIVTLPDGAQSLTVLPGAGGSPVFLGTVDAQALPGSSALNGFVQQSSPAQQNFNPDDSFDLVTINVTTVGTQMRIDWSAVATMLLGTGAQPDFEFVVTVDGNDVGADGSFSYTGPGVPAISTTTVGRTVWVNGLAPGAHTVVLNATFSGNGSTAHVAAGAQLIVEDWVQSSNVIVGGGGGPDTDAFVLLGGDTTGAQSVVPPGTTQQVVMTIALDTTGLNLGGCVLWLSSPLLLETSATQADCVVEILLDGAPLNPRIGATIADDVGPDALWDTFSLMGTLAFADGPHTITLVVTTDANTTATVNPLKVATGNIFARACLLGFFPA